MSAEPTRPHTPPERRYWESPEYRAAARRFMARVDPVLDKIEARIERDRLAAEEREGAK